MKKCYILLIMIPFLQLRIEMGILYLLYFLMRNNFV